MTEDNHLDGDGEPFMTMRSIMVGDARFGDSYHSQEGGGRSVRFDGNVSGLAASGRDRSMLNISENSREQAYASAQRSHVRPDEEVLAHTVADAGLNAFGCVFVEVWVMSDDGRKLTRPNGGHWMDPAFGQSLPSEELIEKAWELDREAGDCPPGAGLPGTMAEEGGLANRNIHWRQIKSLLNDPFIQRESGRRMERLYELGIGLVAAVPFNSLNQRGIVLYYSRSTADVEQLRSASNQRFMLAFTDLIGANFGIRMVREESTALRRNLFLEAIKKVRKELLHDQSSSLATMVMDKERMEELKKKREEAAQSPEEHDLIPRVDRLAVTFAKRAYTVGKSFLRRANNSRKKWRGAKLHGPPRQALDDCLFTFLGSFLTMLTVLKIAKSLEEADGDFAFDGGWYSSTLCIVFALTPAPVGQPRQIFMAHLWNILVGMACREIPTGGFSDFMEWSGAPPDAEYGLPLIWVQALAVGLGISGQAYIGILHPPATGLSLTFASKPQWTWTTIVSVMLADFTVVAISTVYLNLSEKKQYPLYWLGLGWEGSGGSVGIAKSKIRSVRRGARHVKETVSVRGKKSEGEDAV
ncbi:hypothetical protein ACHAXR_007527 [Thalassiosira sp. AJA248-18]